MIFEPSLSSQESSQELNPQRCVEQPSDLPVTGVVADLRVQPAVPGREGFSKREGFSDREEVLAFIQHQFKARFGATIDDDVPSLYRVIDRSGELVAAFGIRRKPDTFFVRHYLGDVIETIRNTMGPGVTGDNLIELSHLCAARPAILCSLAPIIARYFHNQGVRYLVCTATSRLSQFLARKNLAPVTLGTAVESDLPKSLQGSWGTYYDHEPAVLVGDIWHSIDRYCGDGS